MKITTIALIFTLSVTSITSVTAQAEGSAQHSGQASKHSVLAVGHGVLSTVKVASAVVAVPVVVAGIVMVTAGTASIQTAASIANKASIHKHHGPLVITETTITADPAPDKAIVIQNKQTVIHKN